MLLWFPVTAPAVIAMLVTEVIIGMDQTVYPVHLFVLPLLVAVPRPLPTPQLLPELVPAAVVTLATAAILGTVPRVKLIALLQPVAARV